jgi:SAM-dependent methyltransferase
VRELRPLLEATEKILLLHKSQRYGLDHIFLDLPPKPLEWMNLGDWQKLNKREDFIEACQATATALADAVGMKREQTIIDVGFGCGDQDFFFLQKYGPSRIIGYNASQEQVDRAIAKCSILNERRFVPKFGLAPHLPIQSGSADIVLSLDSAYHYNTREKFFQESWNWLNRGGKIGLVDLILNEPLTFKSWFMVVPFALLIGIPLKNLYDQSTYIEKLERTGFSDVQISTIDQNAFSHLPDFIEAQISRYSSILNPSLIKKYTFTSKGMRILAKLKIFRLILVAATKPQSDLTSHGPVEH